MTKEKQGPSENAKVPSTEEVMSRWVANDLALCIGCNRCMDACPVSKKPFTIGELNAATRSWSAGGVPESIREFAWNCIQCGRCVPVCPAGARRDYMMLMVKHKLLELRPEEYRKYLAMKGPFVLMAGKLQQKIYSSVQKASHHKLAKFMETTPKKPAPLLFYPGCYIYNQELTNRTLKLLDHVGVPYNVLGGLNSCCGVPQLLQGDLDMADRCFEALYERILPSTPEIVITGCAECFEALVRIKMRYKADFEVLTVTEFLLRHKEKFPEVKLRGKVTLHDSCRLTRRYGRGGAPREAISRFAELEEMKNSGKDTLCCYYWNMGHDGKNHEHRLQRLEEAKGTAKTMVCDCVSCYEKYQGLDPDFEVLDLLRLFEESLEKARDHQEEGT